MLVDHACRPRLWTMPMDYSYGPYLWVILKCHAYGPRHFASLGGSNYSFVNISLLN